MLLVLLGLPRVLLLCFGFPVLSFRSWSYSIYLCCAVLFWLPHLRKGHDTSFYFYLFVYYFEVLFICFFVFRSFCHCIVYSAYCIAMYVLIVYLFRGFVTAELCIYLGGRIGTDTGVCRMSMGRKNAVECEEHKHTSVILALGCASWKCTYLQNTMKINVLLLYIPKYLVPGIHMYTYWPWRLTHIIYI